MKVAVIGAGIIGAAIAFRLAQKGLQVTVLDQTGPGTGASSKSFGWINASFAETDGYFDLRSKAVNEFRALTDELDLIDCVRWGGCLWWEDDGTDFDNQVAELDRRGHPFSLVDANTFSQLEPNVAHPPARAIHTETEGTADADAVTRALLSRATAAGARLISGRTVSGITVENGKTTGVTTDLGPLAADRVVCATGAWSESLLAGSGINLPMDNQPGLILHTTPVQPIIRHAIMSQDIHFRQTADGRIVLGEIFSGGFDKQTAQHALDLSEDLMARLRRRLPTLDNLRMAAVQIGDRPVPADGLPVIGPAHGVFGLHLAVMHSGVTLAPLVGRLVAEQIADGLPHPFLDPFRHDRFAST